MKFVLTLVSVLLFSGCVTASKGDLKYTRFFNQEIDEVIIDSRIEDPNSYRVHIKGQESKFELISEFFEILKGM